MQGQKKVLPRSDPVDADKKADEDDEAFVKSTEGTAVRLPLQAPR